MRRPIVDANGFGLIRVDVLHVQDLGLADEAAVRNNEAYVSQYLDLLPVADSTLGWMILARQNEAMAGGRHPWLAVGSATGASAFCTDGWQFFGADHRVSGEPVAVRTPSLPSRRLQYECAVAGLQSRSVELAPDAAAEITFCAAYLADHPAASDAGDAEHLHALIATRWGPRPHRRRESPGGSTSLFTQASWLHGAAPTAAEWDALPSTVREMRGIRRTDRLRRGRRARPPPWALTAA